jgi:ATP-binding cassette, subfamily A (ABC1), member 3
VTIALKDAIAASRQELPPDALDYDASGVHLGCLVIHCFLWPILLVCIEFGWFNCLRKKGKKIENEPEELDDDVLKEQQKVENTSESKLAVKADHLRKVYENNVAVKDVCFSLEFGDCFALLGVNGAGKTTTFKCLTNDVVPTKGIPYIVGHDVRKEFSEARKHIGYCPQFDAIFELLTVREHLEFYAKIPTCRLLG